MAGVDVSEAASQLRESLSPSRVNQASKVSVFLYVIIRLKMNIHSCLAECLYPEGFFFSNPVTFLWRGGLPFCLKCSAKKEGPNSS
jgi:hypothetical protein